MNDRETESASLTLTGGIVSPSLTHHFAVEISGESVCICKIVHNLVKYFSCIFSFPFNLRDGKKKVERATVAWWRWRWTSHTGDSGMNEKQKIAYMQMFRTRAITLIQLYQILYVLDVFVLVWESECVCKMAEVLLIPRIIYLRNYSTEAEDGCFFMKKSLINLLWIVHSERWSHRWHCREKEKEIERLKKCRERRKAH